MKKIGFSRLEVGIFSFYFLFFLNWDGDYGLGLMRIKALVWVSEKKIDGAAGSNML